MAVAVAGIIGNQVGVLNDPVTVNRECCHGMLCESGNLLGKLVMSFRRKQNSKRSKSIIMLFQSEDRDCVSVVVSDF